MKRRLIAMLLTICMVFTMLPMGAFVLSAAANDVTITVVDKNGNVVTDSNLSVSVTHVYGVLFNRTQNVTVTKHDGYFSFDKSRYNQSSTKYYTVNATLTVDGDTYTASQQIAKSADSVVLTLKDYTQGEKWVEFGVYYIADGHFPDTFYGYGEAKDYGPAGDNTPLVTINVNVAKLQSAEYSDVVLYQQNVSNSYHFVPAQKSDSNNSEEEYKENLEYATAFWDAVKACMDEASIEAFDATGLYDTFVGYCLKNQGSASKPDNHCDGILSVKPPVYVIEMYDHEGKIFGGYTNDQEDFKSNPIPMWGEELPAVLLAYNKHFNQDIKWKDNGSGVWSGSYITTENGRNYKYNLVIEQINLEAANKSDFVISGTGIKYEKKTGTYYLAAFQSKEDSKERVDYILTYTDGVKDLVFNDQVTSIKAGDKAVGFDGSTNRENYIFQGWMLEGGDGTILSQEDILEKYKSVNEDLTFVAIYMLAPSKYNGTVEVILNGSYDSSTATATGERTDITTIAGQNVAIYVKAENGEYIELVRTATGVYTAKLLNGVYHIYYYDGTDYILSSSQELTINGADRTRYIFFNTVNYDLNGGVGGPDKLLEYHYSDTSVKVDSAAPTRDGYIFTGWKDQYGNFYNSGDVLTNAIGKAYTLTAQWEDAADVFINVTINHGTDTESDFDHTDSKDDVKLDLVFAPDVNTPYLETGNSIAISNTNHAKHDYKYYPVDAASDAFILKTVYLANTPTFTGFSKNNIYTVVTEKYNYVVTSVQTRTNENGDIIIDVELDYNPSYCELEFEVKVDDDVPQGLVPEAAIVKILFWSTEDNCWKVVVEQREQDGVLRPGVRVGIDSATRIGYGHFTVNALEVLPNNTISPYGYRIVVSALVYPDGSIVRVNTPLLEGLTQNSTDLYTVTLGAVGGQQYGDVNGAYFVDGVQNGTLNALITTEGFDVIFDAQGGKVNGFDEQTVEDQYKVPGFDAYVPVRDGGYVFDGWYRDEACTILAVEGEYLKEDIRLYAKWKQPLTVNGMITVGATYEQTNGDGSKTVHQIDKNEWVQTVVVLLQKIDKNGYTETIAEQTLTLDYTKDKYYFNGRIVGFAEYAFSGIPDDGHKYRVQVLIPNYTPAFQNEDESLNNYLDYPSYNHDDFIADFGTEDIYTATVNVHNHFVPEEFELNYSVNAEQIGESFRPSDVEVLITYDDYLAGPIPSEWKVITQMIFDNMLKGNTIVLADGKGSGSDYVWIRRADGVTNYMYGIRLQDITMYNGSKVVFSDELPFSVKYEAPAFYLNGVQNQELTATLIPKTYNIVYKTNGGTLSGNYPTTHTWSFETSIAGIVPTFDGFKFDGWYLDEKFTIPAADYIDASVAEDTTLYAKWIQVMDVVDLIITINHNQLNDEGGLANNYNKTLYTQLTYVDRNLVDEDNVYIDMPGYAKEYRNGLWHTHGDNVQQDVFEVPRYYSQLSSEYDYGVNVVLDDYLVVGKSIVKTEQPDGSTLHTVSITLQYNPDLFNLEFYVDMADSVPEDAYPESVEVKVTSWHDHPLLNTGWEWHHIAQHEITTLTVSIDNKTGYGKGNYLVPHWYDTENQIPYLYRIEVIQLNMADGSKIPMNETIADVAYSGGGYNAEIVVEGGAVPTVDEGQADTTLSGVYAQGEDYNHTQMGTVGAVININRVIFHANNTDAEFGDIFRTFYPAGSLKAGSSLYSLSADGTIPSFYDIPVFEYDTHNKYVFKGWYLDKDSTDRPISWDDVYNSTTHVYAHWIETGTVQKEAADTKKTPTNTYIGFDLIGVQIRDKEANYASHYGNAASGLRFITVLSEELYAQINAISGKTAEYGFVVAKAAKVTDNMGTSIDATLQYKGDNVNGVDTNEEFHYVKNMKCSGVTDHYDGEAYRLYTAVITYTKATGEELERQYDECIAARAYLRYYDANGMLRTHYNNYTGTHFYGGCRASFNIAKALMSK
ncbi:MAG: InlB B-repeat-containing protein [Clostridia bacterium]|nr:InlB B-repeat-containing protein [Clostridia bacterium]